MILTMIISRGFELLDNDLVVLTIYVCCSYHIHSFNLAQLFHLVPPALGTVEQNPLF